jgi:MtN3 and saliva related transmembrane protein
MSGFTLADYFGTIASILLPLIPLPQLLKIYQSKTARDVSIYYILVQILANVFFMLFGIMKNELFVIIPNALLILLNVVMIIMKYYYQRNSDDIIKPNTTINTNINIDTINSVDEEYYTTIDLSNANK